MVEGLLTTVAVRDPNCCPVAPMSTGDRVRSVSQGQPVEGSVTVEVTTDEAVTGDEVPGKQVFSYDSEAVHRVERRTDQNCACEGVEGYGCPVRAVTAENGTIELSFISEDLDVIDPDALESMFDDTGGSVLRNGHVSFDYKGFTVEIDHERSVSLRANHDDD